jgi:amino acid permease
VFNLIVGTGSLLLPKAFSETGYVLSSILIIFLAFTSYLTVTFVVEALSCSNAILKWRRLQYMKREMVSQT